jgi:DNA polymerase-3 subunit alpha
MSKQLNYTMVIDIETTGLPEKISFYKYYDYSQIEKYNSSRIVQIAWNLYNNNGKIIKSFDSIIKPNNFIIPNHEYHKITNEIANETGNNIEDVLIKLNNDLEGVNIIVGHNLMFVENIILNEAYRNGLQTLIDEIKKKKKVCTGFGTENLLKIELAHGKYKMPSLEELYLWCFKKQIDNIHNSKYDVGHIAECYFYIKKNVKF